VTVLNINEPPIANPQELTIAENAPRSPREIGEQVGNALEAVDEDSGDEGLVVWSIESGNEDGFFELHAHGDTGAVVSLTSQGASGLDYESRPRYVLLAKAADKGSPSLFAMVNITVQLLDTNEKPTLTRDQHLSIGELAELRAPLIGGVLNASDPEDGTSADGKL